MLIGHVLLRAFIFTLGSNTLQFLGIVYIFHLGSKLPRSVVPLHSSCHGSAAPRDCLQPWISYAVQLLHPHTALGRLLHPGEVAQEGRTAPLLSGGGQPYRMECFARAAVKDFRFWIWQDFFTLIHIVDKFWWQDFVSLTAA